MAATAPTVHAWSNWCVHRNMYVSVDAVVEGGSALVHC